ncbi:DUF6279 family lipoprotein [Lacimicrobium sp. SS2-24]|uniref:DUF6279 family lipoprotein n=1 Tax=Lacimicrobium sp. SS2-24 TaxID=2005569 RepID=UPI000B4B8619|nr:DUF6279 family lipoprotein [Lacimicrobium sp. SS2-24]
MKKFLLGVVLTISLAGCSTGFVYNNLDWLVHWYIDDYVELNTAQKRVFDQYMGKWLKWHRNQELDSYRRHLIDLQARINEAPLTEAQWMVEFDKGRAHWLRLIETLSDDISDLALTLTDEQIQSLFVALQARNEKREKRHYREENDERVEERIDDVKRWIGPLTEYQQHLITAHVQQLTDNFDAWMAYRRTWQDAARSVLLERQDGNPWRTQLNDVLTRPQQFESVQYQQQAAHNRGVYAKMLHELNRSLTSRQRAHLNREINNLIQQLDNLIGPS